MDMVVEYDDKDRLTEHKEDADYEVKINSIEAGRNWCLLSEIQILVDSMQAKLDGMIEC